MIRNLQNSVLYILTFISCCFSLNAAEIRDYLPIVKKYQAAYNASDFSQLDSFTFTPKEYADLIHKLDAQNPDCLTDFDRTFDVTVFKREFEKSHLYKLKTDSIVINTIQDMYNCSNLNIKKLICFVYFKKRNIAIPVNLIVINLENHQQKILLDIINENYFSYEKL